MGDRTGGGRARLTAALVALAIAAAACGGATGGEPSAAAVTLVAEPVIHPGEAVPTPEDAAVLTLTGKISSTNRGGTLQLDPTTLDALGRRQVTVYEPWVRKTLVFQGVWLADLLKVAQVDGGARNLHLTALDGFQVDISMADVETGEFFVATRTGGGGPISIADGGPTRVLVVSDTPSNATDNRWIWSLSTIDVE